MAAVEFDFEALEPPAPPVLAEDAADVVMETLARAREDADQLRESARAEGFAAGHADAMSSLEPALAALAEAVAGMELAQAGAGGAGGGVGGRPGGGRGGAGAPGRRARVRAGREGAGGSDRRRAGAGDRI